MAYLPHFLDGRVRVEVETALPAFVAARLAVTGEEAEAGPLVPAPAADSRLALVAEVGCMKLREVEGMALPLPATLAAVALRPPFSGLPGGGAAPPADRATDVVVIPVMFEVVPGLCPVSVVTLLK